MFEVAQALKKGLGDKANKAPRFELPNWLARLLAKVKPEMQGVLPELGNKRHLDNQKSRRVFNWNPISSSDAVVATAESLEKLKLLRVN
jgi:dihydroflavonol-4-reductase